MDAADDLVLSTGYEPKAHDFYETTVEPYVQLLDSQPLLSYTTPAADPDYDDSTLEDVLYRAHRAQVNHSVRDNLSFSLSLSMSDRTGQLVGERTGPPGEHRSSEAQIRTLLDDQKAQILAECQAKICQHEFQAARPEEDQQILQGQLLQQKLEFREAHQRNLTEMEELRKFQSSAFDSMARRRFVEDQNTILELSGRVQELQNEVNCVNDSGDFQDGESIRSGNSHVTSQPMLFPKHPIPERYLLEVHQWNSSEEPLHSSTVDKSERQKQDQDPRCQSGPSAKKSVIFSGGDSSKNYGADQQRLQISDLHFDKFPTPATVACWKTRFKTEVCTCSQFPSEAMQWVELVDSVDELRSSSSTRDISMPNFEVLDARIASALNKIIHNSYFKRRISLEEQMAQQDRFLRDRQIAYLINEYFWVTGAHDSVENYADPFTIGLRNDDIQEFDSKWDGILLSMTKIPHDILEELHQ